MCEILFKSHELLMPKKFVELEQYISSRTHCPISKRNDLKVELQNFRKAFMLKWKRCGRHKLKFYRTEKKWLQCVSKFELHQVSKGGRPAKEFAECSEQSKRRKTAELRHTHCTDKLAYAAQMSLRSSGKRFEAKKVLEIVSPSEVDEIPSNNRMLSNEQALSLMMEAQLSRRQYNIIRNYAKDIFPTYKNVRTAKKQCLPAGINVTDVESEVPLQSLLDHTVDRIMHAQTDHSFGTDINKLKLISKWGFDGSSSHTQYMQRFVSDSSDDKYMFITSLVPLRLFFEKENGESFLLWQNPRPSSPRYCRPIKLQYRKETVELAKQEKSNMDVQISNLTETKVVVGAKEYIISHLPLLTMVDGKVCNSLSDTKSTLRCYLCAATSKDFNDIRSMANRRIKRENLSFGISVLHAWIRMLECLLHVAYKLPTRTWRTNNENVILVEENKARIQSEFKSKMSLIIDKPKPGYGNSNDGNVARKFFQNYEMSSSITGIDAALIKKFYFILQILSSGFKVDEKKFRKFCLDTAELYVSLYPWHPMTTTVHKILIHGFEIIANFLLPIGQLSEEAQESRNKDFKIYRERFSRKTSRQANLEDVFQRLLVSSDPLITSLRPVEQIRRKCFDAEVKEMLLEQDLAHIDAESDASED